MSAIMNPTAKLAEWSAGLRFEDIPRRIVEEVKNQILSVIASVHSGHFSECGRSVSRIAKDWGAGKEATLIPSGERTSLQHAIFGNTALSMSLDYDDYCLAGNTAHSAVLCILALGERQSVSGKDMIVAQTIANEVVGRLSLAVGADSDDRQLFSFVHTVGAAFAAARALGLDATQTASALGLALLQPMHGLGAGFFASDGRALLASQAAPIGVMAAQLAAGGFQGNPSILEDDRGFLRAFSDRPALGAFTALGTTWLSDTLSFKMYPASDYLGAVVDCIVHVVKSHPIDARKVRSVEVAAGPWTLATNDIASSYAPGPESSTTTLHFHVPFNVAISLMDKELTPRQFLRERTKDPILWEIASKVSLRLDEELAARAREQDPIARARSADGELDLTAMSLESYRAPYGARVKITMEDGREFQAEEDTPQGAAGRAPEERRRAVEERFRRETRYTLRKEKMEKAIDLVLNLERSASPQVRELVRTCCSERV